MIPFEGDFLLNSAMIPVRLALSKKSLKDNGSLPKNSANSSAEYDTSLFAFSISVFYVQLFYQEYS